MSSSAQFYFEGATVSYPPVKPPWLRPVATAIVIAVHAFVAWITLVTSVPLFHPIDVTLVPSGSPLGLEEQEADEQPPPEEVEQPELAMPAPMIMSPDAPVKEEIVKPKRHVVEKRRNACRRKAQNAWVEKRAAAERANSERRAPGRRALGLPEGRATARSRMDYAALLAMAIRRHTPSRDVRRLRHGARPISRQRLRRHCRNLRLGIQSRGRGAGASHRRLHSRAAAAGRFVLRRSKFYLPLIEPGAPRRRTPHLKARLSTLIVLA